MIFFLINQIFPFFTSDAIMFYPMGNAIVKFYVDTSAYSTDAWYISAEQDTENLTKFFSCSILFRWFCFFFNKLNFFRKPIFLYIAFGLFQKQIYSNQYQMQELNLALANIHPLNQIIRCNYTSLYFQKVKYICATDSISTNRM